MQNEIFNEGWDQDFVPSGASHDLICVLRSDKEEKAKGNKKALQWVVIDPINGITYKTPALKTQNDWNDDESLGSYLDTIREKHNETYHSMEGFVECSYVTRYNFRIPKGYYYRIQESNKALVYRVYSYQPIPIDKKQGMYEFLRIIFSEDKAWIDTRDGERKDITPSMVFGKKSLFSRIFEMNDKNNFNYHNVIGYPYEWDKLDSVFSFKNAGEMFYGAEGSSPYGIAKMFFRGQRKQRFYKDVPEEVKDFLISNGKLLATKKHELNGDVKECMSNALPQYLCLLQKNYYLNLFVFTVTGSMKTWYFRYNTITEEWSSSSNKWTKAVKGIVNEKENSGYCNRKIGLEMFKNTLYDGIFWNIPEEDTPYIEFIAKHNGVLVLGERAKKYTAIEQAAKMKRSDLFVAAVEWANHGNTEYDASLPEAFGVTGKQLKLIPLISRENIYPAQTLASNVKSIMEISELPVETKIKLSTTCYYYNVSSVIAKYKEHDQDPAPFFKAVLKYPENEQSRLLAELQDYHNLLSNIRYDYPNIELHFPELLKPSQVREMHDRVRRLLHDLKEAERNRTTEQENALIAEQKKTDSRMEYTDGVYSLILPKDGDDIRSEGSTLCHCVGGYTSRVASGTTHILFLRKNEDMDKRFFTMEVRDNKIQQFYGYHDSFNKDKEIKNFVEEYAQKMQYEIQCCICA